jgi:N-acyl-D-amino-acid deacylase
MLKLVDDARAEGLDVTFDAYPYEWASTRLLITLPPWVQEGGSGPTKERLADRGVRQRIRSELRDRGVLYAGAGGIADIRLGYFARPENLRFEARTLGDVGKEIGGDLVDVGRHVSRGIAEPARELGSGLRRMTGGLRRPVRKPLAKARGQRRRRRAAA